MYTIRKAIDYHMSKFIARVDFSATAFSVFTFIFGQVLLQTLKEVELFGTKESSFHVPVVFHKMKGKCSEVSPLNVSLKS